MSLVNAATPQQFASILADVIERRPDLYDQDVWGQLLGGEELHHESVDLGEDVVEFECGSAHCIAGLACVIDGYFPASFSTPTGKVGFDWALVTRDQNGLVFPNLSQLYGYSDDPASQKDRVYNVASRLLGIEVTDLSTAHPLFGFEFGWDEVCKRLGLLEKWNDDELSEKEREAIEDEWRKIVVSVLRKIADGMNADDAINEAFASPTPEGTPS